MADPCVASEVGRLQLAIMMGVWTILTSFPRLIARLLFEPKSRCYYDVAEYPGVEGLVALTIDDAFCRQSQRECSLIEPLRWLLASNGARATFFCTLNFCTGTWREHQIEALLEDGHELANHCIEDRPYHRDSEEEFERAFDATDAWIKRQGRKRLFSKAPISPGTRWFRAPCGMLSDTMLRVVQRKGATSVLTDCYADDCHIPRPRFIAWAMCRRVTHGSILILHMPEVGFREWGLESIRLVLDDLKERGLRAVTLSELAAAAASASKEAACSRNERREAQL